MAATGLELSYPHRRPSSFLDSIFMSTANVAAATLVSVASTARSERLGRWRPADHLRFMLMLSTWLTVWFLRVLMDWFPFTFAPFPRRLLAGFSFGGCRGGGGTEEYSRSPPLMLPSSSSSAASSALSSSAMASLSNMDLIPYETVDGPSIKSLGRALTQIFTILNEMPATSRKYQFAMAMAEKIMDENARSGAADLLLVNRAALAAGFSRTSSLLHDALHRIRALEDSRLAGAWPSRLLGALPFSSYLSPYLKYADLAVTTVAAIIPKFPDPARPLDSVMTEYSGELTAEKLGQELLWMTQKLREYGAVEEAMLQWSFASGLASVSFGSDPRIQGVLVKISAMLLRDLTREEVEEMVPSEVKFGLLSLWLPLLCHARNGYAYPALMGYEKVETERAVNQVIGSLPAVDQEVVLMNWLQDYSVSVSEWPNLQVSYDRWCHETRELVAA